MFFPIEVPPAYKDAFIAAFKQKFPEGEIKEGLMLEKTIELHVRLPTEQKDGLIAFYEEFCGSVGLPGYKVIEPGQNADEAPWRKPSKAPGSFQAT